ncbi:receptor-like protein 6 [Punica granatum]|uniref:Receptor-like protein 6 n=1 Tax=Punica granatum TaxID=22663 RepID=A0A6P8CAP7_PUNGR|nr:receptor-like protein 6 [Punica granatum]
MCSSLYFLVLFVQLLCSQSRSQSVPVPQCDGADMSALLQFKNSFTVDRGFASRDPLAYPKTESWKLESAGNVSSSSCCSWEGVECDNSTGRIIALNLSSSCLYGSINSNSSLFRLVHLQRLNLADNHFNNSEIPSGVGLLSSLTHLNLSSSVFSGQIPTEISKLTKLVTLDLGCNGTSELCAGLLKLRSLGLTNLVQNLSNLQVLALDNVDLSSEVPVRVANLSSLTYLSLESCGLYGVFPASIFRLPKLEYVSLVSNGNLTGHLPEFNSTSPLQFLQLSTTSFSGELPDSLGDLQSLKFLNVERCNFSGSFPSSFSNLTELTYLSFRGNPFTAQRLDSLPWLWKLAKLDTLYIGQTNLQGKIPSSIGNLSHLVTLGLAGNELEGEIPPELVNLPRLAKLNLWDNQLSGHITSCLTNMTQISFLDLSSNYFDGPIPSSVSQLQNLQFLWLFGNLLSGIVELDTFLQMKRLQILQLSWNELSCLAGTKQNVTPPQLLLLGLGSCNLSEFPSFLKDQTQMGRI